MGRAWLDYASSSAKNTLHFEVINRILCKQIEDNGLRCMNRPVKCLASPISEIFTPLLSHHTHSQHISLFHFLLCLLVEEVHLGEDIDMGQLQCNHGRQGGH